MNENLTQTLEADSHEIQNMIGQTVAEAIKSLPRPQMPPWMESLGDFIQMHPWTSLLIALLIIILISVIIREIICSYLKTNEILHRLKKIEEKFKSD